MMHTYLQTPITGAKEFLGSVQWIMSGINSPVQQKWSIAQSILFDESQSFLLGDKYSVVVYLKIYSVIKVTYHFPVHLSRQKNVILLSELKHHLYPKFYFTFRILFTSKTSQQSYLNVHLSQIRFSSLLINLKLFIISVTIEKQELHVL